VAALFVLRRRGPMPGYQTPGFPITPVVFLALVVVLLVLLAGHDPLQAALGVGIVAVGAPVYLLVFRTRRGATRAYDVDSDYSASGR